MQQKINSEYNTDKQGFNKKLKDNENKIPNVSVLVTIYVLDTKIEEVEKKHLLIMDYLLIILQISKQEKQKQYQIIVDQLLILFQIKNHRT